MHQAAAIEQQLVQQAVAVERQLWHRALAIQQHILHQAVAVQLQLMHQANQQQVMHQAVAIQQQLMHQHDINREQADESSRSTMVPTTAGYGTAMPCQTRDTSVPCCAMLQVFASPARRGSCKELTQWSAQLTHTCRHTSTESKSGEICTRWRSHCSYYFSISIAW
jgi:hypothetical protein